jgi:hypothetical protein
MRGEGEGMERGRVGAHHGRTETNAMGSTRLLANGEDGIRCGGFDDEHQTRVRDGEVRTRRRFWEHRVCWRLGK